MVKLYYQTSAGFPIRVYDIYAAIGAKDLGIKVCPYEFIDEVPGTADTIVVGNVPDCLWWLNEHGYKTPEEIDLTKFTSFMNRRFERVENNKLNSFHFPCFIKPTKAKAFNAGVYSACLEFLMTDKNSKYKDDYYISEVVLFESEWRVYIRSGKIIGCKHYSGNHLLFPHVGTINSIVEYAETILDNHSYTIDVGIQYSYYDKDEFYTTHLVELNDGFAIGNYGVEPTDYYLFLRDRWLQLTGLRHKKEFIV